MTRRRAAGKASLAGFSSRPTSVSSKGQATIPAEIRREAGIQPGDQVVFSIASGRVVLEKVQPIDEVWNAGQAGMLGEWSDPEQDIYND